LTFDGNGATFRAEDDGDQDRRHFWIIGGGGITIQDVTVVGANPHAGTGDLAYRSDRAFQHAFALQGVQGATLTRLAAYDVYGDFVYLGPDTRKGMNKRWSSDVQVTDSTFARNGRQGISTVAARDVLIARNDIREVRHATFNFEPTGTSWGAERVTVEDNVTGNGRLLWLSSGGQGSNVRDIVVRRNRMEGKAGAPVIYLKTPEGHRRGPITVEDNEFLVSGSPAPGFRFIRTDGVRFSGNRATFPENRAMTAVSIEYSDDVVVTGNDFVGHAQLARIIESTNVTVEEGGPSAPSPGEEEPAAPIAEEPSGPVGEEPSGPVGEEPSGPVGEEPSGPVGEEPSDPVGEEPPGPVGEEPPAPALPAPPVDDPEPVLPAEEAPAPAITLDATGGKHKGLNYTTLLWSGVAGTVNVFADGRLIGEVDTQSYIHQTGQRGNPTVTYQVCGPQSCSSPATVSSW
jgi:hypothetical protein